ncbi:MAG: C10 family peptidase [Lentimicrobium sp.]|nr:C10 family peptidase [Lentimicrobium sp.]
MIKRTTTLLIFLLMLTIGFAGEIPQNLADKVAKVFLHSRAGNTATYNPELLQTKPAIVVGTGFPLFYAINFSEGGFVLVSATDGSIPVLGYSPVGEFSLINQSPSLLHWIEGYELQLQEIITGEIAPTPEITAAWDDLLNYEPGKSAFGRSNRQVEPMLPCTWNQGAPYNDLCPEDISGPGGHVYSGCVATAMSQIMYYWRHPRQGTGSNGYYSGYGYLFVDFSQADYNYEEMTNAIGSEGNYEMAEIQYHCGVAVDMMYSPTGSGAYSFDAASALRNNFGYSNSLSLKSKDNYTNAAWAELMIQNLENGWPMYYNGYGSGGHAFNLDGFQGDDYFHFNWGWGGSSNGYYYLNNLNPGGSNFTDGQGAIINFFPAGNYPDYCDGVKTLTLRSGTIEDGSGPVNPYISGLNCGWVIAPADSVTGLTLNFEKFDLTDGMDVLNVFDGPDASYPLLASLTGSDVPSPVNASGDKLYIEFMTSGEEGSGFRLSYTSNFAVYCSGQTLLSDPEGMITDGSGTRNYNNNSVCKFRVEPEGATSITFTFTFLDTEPVADAVKIYDLVSQTLIGSFSGNTLPDPVTVPSGKAMLLFVTNNEITGEGWEVEYTSASTTVGTSHYAFGDDLNLNIYPVPAKDLLRVDLQSSVSTEVTLTIFDISGRMVADQSAVKFDGKKSVIISVSSLSDGIYYLRYVSDGVSGTRKVIIKN